MKIIFREKFNLDEYCLKVLGNPENRNNCMLSEA